MQGRKDLKPKMMYQVHLDDLVPKENFYRRLDEVLDLNFLYKETEQYYGSEGQDSIDPVVFFKICLVGYLNNINSDRRLIEYCSNCLDVRLFIRYDIDEPLPWHSTISRTRQLYGEEVFLSLFKKVLSLCVHKGMVRGKRQAIDSAFIKANASMDSLIEKEVVEDAEYYCKELNEGSEFKISKSKKAQVDYHNEWKKEACKYKPGHYNHKENPDENGHIKQPRFLSNHTHYSSTDTDAKIAVKPGKPRQLVYFGQLAVDDSNHVITGAMADHADQRDSQCLPAILSQTIENLLENEITLEQVAADTGYSSGEALKFCEENNIDAYIPNFGKYIPSREGFEYDKANDRYLCTRGNKAILPFKKLRLSHGEYNMKHYASSNKDCRDCSLRSECIGKSDIKKISDTIDKLLFDNMHQKMQTAYASRIKKKKSSTVEPVLGTLINFLNMKRVNTRGIRQANKHVLMAALAYNLKKYLNFKDRKPVVNIQAITRVAIDQLIIAFFRFISSLLNPSNSEVEVSFVKN
jgi:transposase